VKFEGTNLAPGLLTGMKSAHVQSASHRAFGHAVRELRAYRGLSQEALGYAAGLHRNYVGAIERGELNPTIRTVLRLAVGLRVRPTTLVQLAEERLSADNGGEQSGPRKPINAQATGTLTPRELAASS
jgi:transcriptional regulator with XRE-family HTH domain